MLEGSGDVLTVAVAGVLLTLPLRVLAALVAARAHCQGAGGPQPPGRLLDVVLAGFATIVLASLFVGRIRMDWRVFLSSVAVSGVAFEWIFRRAMSGHIRADAVAASVRRAGGSAGDERWTTVRAGLAVGARSIATLIRMRVAQLGASVLEARPKPSWREPSRWDPPLLVPRVLAYGGGPERAPGGGSLSDFRERVLDKGIVVSGRTPDGIDLTSGSTRIVVVSIDAYIG